ncbi:hypothetical protein MPTK1_7g04250 [Marchantia polymorpha subsp. ruderalis]|uniref:Methyltransferase domain-containing protein n=2 Tax=Marchantia polymorpha TaxID=3197 RepID=A0AAF6BW09_MARPO|nr:hypothetical protein MARPO_0062s0100 [Marchantia polymorpha]BBN16193.1 hypothetical protein Mp_7g04250 [Marchantia polymorpha subsp. ruderalis]|eukprot:PTQ36689.1 hypothetical protein MARPO_0062s0100 [Marchantia polymorpha]
MERRIEEQHSSMLADLGQNSRQGLGGMGAGMKRQSAEHGSRSRLSKNAKLTMRGGIHASSPNLLEHDAGLNIEERVEAALTDFIFDGSKTTSIAHKTIVRPGDTVIDVTCGNGHNTLMLAKLVLQEATAGYVIGLDIQQGAIDNKTALLD